MTPAADGPGLYDKPQSGPVWGALASITLHSALLVLLVLSAGTHPLEPGHVRSIAVELVSAAQFAALLAPAPALPRVEPEAVPLNEPPATPVAPAAAETPDAAAPTGTTRATEFYAGGLLAEPASARLRESLQSVESRERLVQLCSIEAMEQVRRAEPVFDPDTVVAYAFAETRVQDGTLVADGAAFRSRREWYGVKFSCEGAPDFSAVRSFEFSVGALIPHEDWEAHYLTAEEAGD